MDYFFSAQIRQYRLQIIRAFSNFNVSMGENPDGSPKLKKVPCRYGDTSRIAETIITGNSENKIPSAPFISVYVTGMSLSPERRAAPSLVSTVNVNERAYDGAQYLDVPGNRYSVQRYAPVPFVMTVNVDFWCSNINQKEELFEQTQVLFNGMVDLQTSNNPLDWTLFTTLEPTNIIWSSRTIPIGTDNPIDVMTVEYRVPIWINPPAKVTYQKAVQQIVNQIHSGHPDAQDNWEWTSQDLLTTQITTPDFAHIKFRLIDNFRYEISLCDHAFNNEDLQQLPTVITGSHELQAVVGEKLLINKIPITITTADPDQLLVSMKQQLKDTAIIVKLINNVTLQIAHAQGSDIVLENVTGTPVEKLGFLTGIYPGGKLAWWRLLEKYGSLRTHECDGGASSLILLTQSSLDDRTHDVKGTIEPHPLDNNLLIWSVDASTWPTATLNAIQAIINPQQSWPGLSLPPAQVGQRYLLADDMPSLNPAWGPCAALANDVIEFDGTSWVTVFASSQHTQAFVQNQFSLKWYKFDAHNWQVWPQQASRGYWRLEL